MIGDWKEDYTFWLLSHFEIPMKYSSICMVLNQHSFYSPIEMDLARIDDAMSLREKYIEYVLDVADNIGDHLIEYAECDDVSCLEVLLVSAQKAYDEFSMYIADSVSAIFIFFLSGMNIDIPNSSFNSIQKNYETVSHAITKWLDREYGTLGEDGNILCVSDNADHIDITGDKPPIDFRKMSIWDQINVYILDILPF